jgi:predicted RNA-binding protein with PUA domain
LKTKILEEEIMKIKKPVVGKLEEGKEVMGKSVVENDQVNAYEREIVMGMENDKIQKENEVAGLLKVSEMKD